jgi:hypothetical protein
MLSLTDPNPSLPVPTLQPYDEFSRYRGLALLAATDAGGRPVLCVSRRFLPQPASLAQVGTVTVDVADRLDLIAARQLGDPRWWWRIADANGAVDPADLTAQPGTVLSLTLPQGMTLPRT